ncbi:hypothetical protein [Shewanella chilikensis]|uniref:hypothetical protein n=1 Tax=Shewanella chilikensis TaxID=558541 RepID=UPI003999D57F
MLATVTDAHMPGDLVQSAGEVLWLSSLFLAGEVFWLSLLFSAPISMLATVTDVHMPGDLVQFAGEVFWLSSLFRERKRLAHRTRAFSIPAVSAEGGGVVWIWNGFRLIVQLIACRRPYAYAPQ